MKEYEEFIQDYEDSQKRIKLFVDIDSNSNFDYESKNIDIGEFKKSEKFIPKINLVKKSMGVIAPIGVVRWVDLNGPIRLIQCFSRNELRF